MLNYAVKQPNTPIQLARYARSAQDFYFSALARFTVINWVFSSQFISTLRLPTELGWADLQHSEWASWYDQRWPLFAFAIRQR
ncbi:hypothetical protein P4S72_18295 [Vibrio sp. PP-XX7]